jgi:ribosomal protein L37AE/L43A
VTNREDPPTIPPCPRCKATTAEWDDEARAISGRGWYCAGECNTYYAGTATEAQIHAARTAAEARARGELAETPPVLRVIRGDK